MPLNNPNKEKDPNSTRWFYIDWQLDLETGDSVSSCTWTLTGGLTQASVVIDGTNTRIKLAGGTLGAVATASARMTTTNGEITDRTLHITIVEK